MGKKYKRLFVPKGITTKPPLVKPGSLDEFGFENITKGSNDKNCLTSLIRFGVPCLRHNAFYLTQWKKLYLDSEYYSLNRS